MKVGSKVGLSTRVKNKAIKGIFKEGEVYTVSKIVADNGSPSVMVSSYNGVTVVGVYEEAIFEEVFCLSYRGIEVGQKVEVTLYGNLNIAEVQSIDPLLDYVTVQLGAAPHTVGITKQVSYRYVGDKPYPLTEDTAVWALVSEQESLLFRPMIGATENVTFTSKGTPIWVGALVRLSADVKNKMLVNRLGDGVYVVEDIQQEPESAESRAVTTVKLRTAGTGQSHKVAGLIEDAVLETVFCFSYRGVTVGKKVLFISSGVEMHGDVTEIDPFIDRITMLAEGAVVHQYFDNIEGFVEGVYVHPVKKKDNPCWVPIGSNQPPKQDMKTEEPKPVKKATGQKDRPHCELIKWWAEGGSIQRKEKYGWVLDDKPDWNPKAEYRIDQTPNFTISDEELSGIIRAVRKNPNLGSLAASPLSLGVAALRMEVMAFITAFCEMGYAEQWVKQQYDGQWLDKKAGDKS